MLSVESRATILELVGGAQVALMKGGTLGPSGLAILVPQAAKGPADVFADRVPVRGAKAASGVLPTTPR